MTARTGRRLVEVFNRALEHTHIVAALYVLVETVADTLRVTHFTEDSSVGGCDTLDGEARIVGIEVDIGRGVSEKVNVLGCDLSVFGKLLDKLVRRKEASLAV